MNPYALIDRIIVDTDDGQHVAELCDGALNEQGEYIVKCVNAHDELVDALESARDSIRELVGVYGAEDDESDHWYEATGALCLANDALFRARGGQP
jgi:hypothetical protein